MKDIIYFIKETYENWKVTPKASNFIKDCIFDMLEAGDINKDEYDYDDIIQSIILEIDKLDNKSNYRQLRTVLASYPQTNFKDGIHLMIDEEIQNYFKSKNERFKSLYTRIRRK